MESLTPPILSETYAYFVNNIFPALMVILGNIYGIVIAVSFIVAIVCFIGIIFCVEGLKNIRRKERELYDPKVVNAFDETQKGDPNMAGRWESVKRHIESTNENDWKQAIIESDIILEELLTKMEYRGESVGEKLKRVEKSDFDSLNEAWEAHKARNQIAHEGSSFTLSHYEAKRIINMYKKVFEEFYYI